MTVQTGSRSTKLMLLALLFVLVGLLFFLYIVPSLIFAVKGWLVVYVAGELVRLSGWDRHLVTAGLILLLIPFCWAVRELLRVRWPAFRRPEHRLRYQATKNLAYFVLSLYLAGYFGALYLAGRSSNFDQFGQPLKFCADTPEGLVCESEPGRDRKYNLPLEPMTSEDIIAAERRARGLIPEHLEFATIDDVEFFDRLDGRPLVWFYELPSGEIELYNRSGRHTTYGDTLREVQTREEVERIRQYFRGRQEDRRLQQTRAEQKRQADALAAEEARRAAAQRDWIARYLGQDVIRASRLGLVVIDKTGAINHEIAEQISAGVDGASILFTAAFVRDGLFQKAFEGSSEPLSMLGLGGVTARVLLAVHSTETTKQSFVDKDLVKAESTIHCRLYSRIDSGFSSRTIIARAVGAAFSDAEAIRKADHAAATDLVSKLAELGRNN